MAWEWNPDNPQQNSGDKNPIFLAAAEATKPPTLNADVSGNCARKSKKGQEEPRARPKHWTK